MSPPSPFHPGEQEMQRRVGKRDRIEAFGQRAIRDHMPDQHRAFFEQLPFLVAGIEDDHGRPWAGIIGREVGFLSSPDPKRLTLQVDARKGDPLRAALTKGRAIGLLGLEYHSRRRNRVNGQITGFDGTTLDFSVAQSFGNCPQYIHPKDFVPTPPGEHPPDMVSALTSDVAAMLQTADHVYVASALPGSAQVAGADVSHRGGAPGFIQREGNMLYLPEYSGNNQFNTLGNFLLNPLAGLLVSNFATGDILSMTGRVELDMGERADTHGAAPKGWRFFLDEGVLMRGGLPFALR